MPLCRWQNCTRLSSADSSKARLSGREPRAYGIRSQDSTKLGRPLDASHGTWTRDGRHFLFRKLHDERYDYWIAGENWFPFRSGKPFPLGLFDCYLTVTPCKLLKIWRRMQSRANPSPPLNSLLTGKNTGNFVNSIGSFRPLAAVNASICVTSAARAKSWLGIEQGIIRGLSGNSKPVPRQN